MIEDYDGYKSWLTDLLTEFAAEAARRNLEESSSEAYPPPLEGGVAAE